MAQNKFIDSPGAKRTDFPDGSYLLETQSGEKYLVSESGDVNAHFPEIKKVGVADLAQVVRHEVVTVHDTTSHTLHLVGGGVFSYLHHRDGKGMSFQSKRILWRSPDAGVLVIDGTAV
jgi:hypothetical protein